MSNLSSKQLIVALYLAMGMKKADAATKGDVTAQTVSKWEKLPAFEAKKNEYRHQLFEEAQVQFMNLLGDAVSTLDDIMKNASSEKARLEAAKYILDKLQVIQDGCPGVLTIGETTEEEIIYKRKMDKARSEQSKLLEKSSVLGFSSF